jgi:hypothetical protein
MTGLAVVLGNGKILGFHAEAEGHGCVVIAANADLVAGAACWSVKPCLSFSR